MVEIVFWGCVVGVVTPYTIYPLMLYLLSRFRRPVPPADHRELTVTFVISAFNESSVIQQKLENTMRLAYPAEKMQVIVISDASDDGTDEIVAGFDRVILCRQMSRKGKSAGITAFAHRFTGEIIVFSDANSMYRSDALHKLVRNFGDPKVGFAVGQQKYRSGSGDAAESEKAYWDFEVRLKTWEGRLSSVVGGDGAIMAIRRALFVPLRSDDINDFVLPLRIVGAGYRGLFEAEAVCYEEAAPTFIGEFRRKVRIVNRSLRAVLRTPEALNPFRVGIFSWQLICHKVIRWFAGYLMLGALVCSLWLNYLSGTVFSWLLGIQILFYSFAALRCVPLIGNWKPVVLCYYFCLSNFAASVGILNVGLGRKFITWTPHRTSAEVEFPRSP